MKRADATIENVRGSIVLRPESERGAQWMREHLPKLARFQNGVWVLNPDVWAAKVVAVMMDAGLEVRQTPLYYHETGRLTSDGETIH